MARLILGVALAGMLATSAAGQSPPRPPVIDVHVHSPNTSGQQALERMKSLNIRHMLVASLAADLPAWAAAVDASQFTPSLVLPCAGGRANITGRPWWEGATDFPDLSWLRDEIRAGRIKALGELTPQYMGISPQDPRLEPYWQLAEELDLPIGIHMGPGPPGAAYESSPAPVKSPKRIMFGSDFAEQVGPGIDAIVGADFLSAEQKADILCNNAARFLRLNASVCSS